MVKVLDEHMVDREFVVGDSVSVAGLATSYGPLGYTLKSDAGTVTMAISAGVRVPRGGIVVVPPARRPFRMARVNGVSAPVTAEGGVVVRAVPARVVLSP